MKFEHISVLLTESIENLNIKENGIYVDATLGGGGHSLEILKRLGSEGKLIGIDQDEQALKAAALRLKDFKDQTIIVKNNFVHIDKVLNDLQIDKVDGVLLDIGVSSHQLDEGERGFSYMKDAPLDMRMDREQTLSAYTVVNEYPKELLTEIFYKYGEEKWSKRIAEKIVEERINSPIKTTLDLVSVLDHAIPKKVQRQIQGHFAKRVFQAIRIEVNQELRVLEEVIPKIVNRLKSGGRLCIITFHSLEDRIVKNSFKELNKDCVCPPEIPVCVCNHRRQVKLITRKPIEALKIEKENNARSRSAKLRVCEKI